MVILTHSQWHLIGTVGDISVRTIASILRAGDLLTIWQTCGVSFLLLWNTYSHTCERSQDSSKEESCSFVLVCPGSAKVVAIPKNRQIFNGRRLLVLKNISYQSQVNR